MDAPSLSPDLGVEHPVVDGLAPDSTDCDGPLIDRHEEVFQWKFGRNPVISRSGLTSGEMENARQEAQRRREVHE